MRGQNPFRLQAKNSLKINQIHQQNEKNLLNTFKSGYDLRGQLAKSKQPNSGSLINNKLSSSIQKNSLGQIQKSSMMQVTKKKEQQILTQEVVALDNFKAPVSRQKTKDLIQNIKLRRREKHIEALSSFKEDLDDYKQNLLSIYSSLIHDTRQVLIITENQLDSHLNTFTDQYLLSRQKEFLSETTIQVSNFQENSLRKIQSSKMEIERIKTSRKDVVENTCSDLREQLIEIAFVLEGEAVQIEAKQRSEIQGIQKQYYEKYKQEIINIGQQQVEKNTRMQQKGEQIIKKWREIKEQYELQQYAKDCDRKEYRNPEKRRRIYDKAIQLQKTSHKLKFEHLSALINERPDVLTKNNLDKWAQIFKAINDQFDSNLDTLISELMQELEQSKNHNQLRFNRMKNRLQYIQLHQSKPQQLQEILKLKCTPLLQRNNKDAHQLIKRVTDYIENYDNKENDAINSFVNNVIIKIATKNDENSQEFNILNQKYELEKAKILDDDQQKLDKLNQEFAILKKQLRESLHHIKLDEVQKRCFGKIDQIQTAYRKTHQNNKELIKTRLPSLKDFMESFESKIAQIFQLYDPSKRAQLEEKNRQETQQQAMRIIQEQDKIKAQQQARVAQETKKKTGKAPPAPKPKDPKKAAAEIQERKKVILGNMGQRKIQQLKSESGKSWLVFKSVEQICRQFYLSKQVKDGQNKVQEGLKQQNGNQQLGQQKQEKRVLEIDQVQQVILDASGEPAVCQDAFLRIKDLAILMLSLRNSCFQSIGIKSKRVYEQAEDGDQVMMEESLVTLDNRLRQHYSMKGKLQTEVYTQRSAQISNHKKKYQKYARMVKQKMDLQTQKFNYLLEKSLQLLKSHSSLQNQVRQHIAKGKNLSQLQGLFGKARQNSNVFGNQLKYQSMQLERLSNAQIDILLKKNEQFIHECKMIQNGGEYSSEEIEWYKQMVGEINKQIEQQKTKRNQKMKELNETAQKRRKQLLQKFEKEYLVTIEQLSAKDGTGKKYGRPKRIAQERIRLEMNKCQKAQISIDQQLKSIEEDYFSAKNRGFRFEGRPPTLRWRQLIMGVQSCITRYARHIEALNQNIKVSQMIRVNYDQSLPECALPSSSEEQDKKRLQKEIAALGPLAQQKDDRPFTKYVQEIEKVITDQTRTIYTGDKSKYLTGNDKIPDFLRVYIANMKKNAQEFRLNSIRQLRNTCQRLSELSQKLSQMFFISLTQFYLVTQEKNFHQNKQLFNGLYQQHYSLRQIHLRALRPNLSNPKCQGELAELDQKQKQRSKQFEIKIKQSLGLFEDSHFQNAGGFLNGVLNNFQFLVLFLDCIYLKQDFVKVPGDEAQDKIHLDIKRLMLMKQKGIKIDSNSERNLKRKWQGIKITIFDIGEKKFVYTKVAAEQPKQKDKKGAKKEAKDPKKQVEESSNQNPELSKQIQTFKTWRQKSVFTFRNQSYDKMTAQYLKMLVNMKQSVQKGIKENDSFKIKWQSIASELYA